MHPSLRPALSFLNLSHCSCSFNKCSNTLCVFFLPSMAALRDLSGQPMMENDSFDAQGYNHHTPAPTDQIPSQHFLPGNPMPYMAPSSTHEPELLLLQWTLHIIKCIISTILQHPLVLDPIPGQRHFTDQFPPTVCPIPQCSSPPGTDDA